MGKWLLSLPIFIGFDSKTFSLFQTRWASQLNQLLKLPMLSGIALTEIPLSNGVTVINHKLQRQMEGWLITDINGAATIYRSAPLSPLTLSLTSNAAVMVDLWIF